MARRFAPNESPSRPDGAWLDEVPVRSLTPTIQTTWYFYIIGAIETNLYSTINRLCYANDPGAALPGRDTLLLQTGPELRCHVTVGFCQPPAGETFSTSRGPQLFGWYS
jgi:hypothetical protein